MKVTANLTAFSDCFYKLIFSCFCLLTGISAFAQLPVPAFTANPVSGCAPLQVDFSDQSTGATSWQWDLGNGVTSSQQNPSTLYANPGVYTVKLTVTNASGSQTITKTNYITVNAPPTVDFSSNVNSGCFPLNVQFFDNSSPGSGSIVSWNWSFGNGFTSTQQNPSYSYTTSGTYFVSLTVTNSAGCGKTLIKPAFITVPNGVKADFDVSPVLNCKPPETISFTNNSTGPGTLSYQWDFGDGNTSTATNPSNNYLTAGPFTVRLIATSSQGCVDTLIKTNVVNLNNIQTIIGAPATACINENISFQNLSTPAPLSSNWSFGDLTSSAQINPVKSYTTAGSYVVKLVNQYSICKDSITKPIDINPRPSADFTSIDTIACKPPHTVNFQDQSVGAVSWEWTFGDGGASTLQNPTYTYNTYGDFTVRLIVKNSFGCSDTMIKTAFIRIQKVIFNPLIIPNEGCKMLTSNFFANSTSVDSIATWFWDFGNGNTANTRNASNIFDSGSYTIKLKVVTVQGCIDSITITNGVRVGTKPTAQFNGVPVNVCAFTNVQFNDLSTGNPDQWAWSFGDGSTSPLQNPTYAYSDTGTFTIRLIAYNNRCADTMTRIAYIKVLPPIAKFNYAINCAVNKRQVQFTDQSTVPTSWLWDFGDGNTSTLQNPSHTYAALGTYNVTLTSRNGACSHSITKQITLVDIVPSFNASQTTVCRKYQAVTFTNTTPNPSNIAAYLWNFGDLTTSAQPSPSHTYNASGTYTVTLTITDINGCITTITKLNHIRVNGPVAGFTVGSLQNCIRTNINFNNNIIPDGVNAITSIKWDMGNGSTVNSLANPFLYTYLTSDTFTVTQMVTDASGCADTFAIQNIAILDPKAKFYVDTPFCPGVLLAFKNLSTGVSPSVSYQWTVSDGFTSTLLNPVHAFAGIGNYTIKLLATEPIGCKDSSSIIVRVDRPKASFTINDSLSICQPFQAKLTNTSYFAANYRWSMGDGTTSTETSPTYFYGPGTYTVRLISVSYGSCEDTAYKTIKVGRDTGTLNYAPLTGCAPLSISLQTRTDIPLNYTWDFGDGNLFTTADSNRTHTYDAGTYIPKVIIKDRLGCFGIIEGIDTIKALGTRPNFGVLNYLLCDSGIVQFTDSTLSTDVITGYLWDFGDGNTSTAALPSHKYISPGLYNVTLTITTLAGCTNSKTKNAVVKVVPSPQIGISGVANSCIPANFNLQGNWLNPDTSIIKWRWNIDGVLYNTQNPPAITRTGADSVFISLIATNGSGCADTTTDVAVAYGLPKVNAGKDTTICLGTFATLNPTGASSYVWSPATYLNCTNCTSPFAGVSDSIQYTVTGTSSVGCVNKDSIIVKVNKPFKIAASKGDTICIGDKIPLISSGADRYVWTPPAGLSNAGIANPVASPTTTTTYLVTGIDSLNCFRDSVTIPIVVYNYPTVRLKDTSLIAGDTIRLDPGFSTDVTNAFWNPNNNLSCVNCLTPLAWPTSTTTYRVTASNPGGCTTTKLIKVNVSCGKDNIFMPNAFTPNNDNLNDKFYVIGGGLQSVVFMRIYNRWGNLVFEKVYFEPNNPSLGWNGKINGVDAPPGMYSYSAQVICGDGGIIPLQGAVMLIR